MNSRNSTRDPTRRNWYYRIDQLLLRIAFPLWLRFRVRGLEHVPTRGGALLVCNHQSFLDPALVGLALSRPVSFLARDTLFRVPVLGWIIRTLEAIPIDRDSASTQSLRDMISRLQAGHLVGLFPEGTRTEDGSIGALKPGFVTLIRRTKLPVIPVAVAGAHRSMPRHCLLPRPERIRVVFGQPMTPDDLAPLIVRGKEAELVNEVRERMIECLAAAEAWRMR